ncbi:Tetratricopeptide repeat-domain-containing protein, partial [Pseudoneurospora amorphoporcata]
RANSVIDDDVQKLLRLLGGLPLALAQAAAYMGEAYIPIARYIDLYEKQWGELFRNTDSSLLDYDNRSVMTTWTISFSKIKAMDKNAGNLLRLWAFLDNREMWHSLLQWPKWLRDIVCNEVKFLNIATLLLRYSIIEAREFLWWMGKLEGGECNIEDITIGHATHSLGNLYSDQGRLKEAETMYQRALEGKEKVLGPDHTSTLETVNNLGLLYTTQGRLKEAEAMYQRALEGMKSALRL